MRICLPTREKSVGALDYFRFFPKFVPFQYPEELEGFSSETQGKWLCTTKAEITNLERIVTNLFGCEFDRLLLVDASHLQQEGSVLQILAARGI